MEQKGPVSVPRWDAVVITASSAAQAEGYTAQINGRRAAGQLPAGTDFLVIPDQNGQRVGSAGSTLAVLRALRARYGGFAGRRFLCIHAGGDARRCPPYAAIGKLFAPLPAELNGRPATLFDRLTELTAALPARLPSGLLLLAGDVMLLFDPRTVDVGTADAAVISFRAAAAIGEHHGVYLADPETGAVRRFLHKQPLEKLTEAGAVDARGQVALDTGALFLGTAVEEKLYALVADDEGFARMVNPRARLSLYGDIAYCLSRESTEDGLQKEAPEGDFCPELTEGRRRLFRVIGGYTMKLVAVPGRFRHFGSIPDILRLLDAEIGDYTADGWQKQVGSAVPHTAVAAYNAMADRDARVGTGTYLENACVRASASVGAHAYISCLALDGVTVPDGVLLHGVRLSGGRVACEIFGTADDPKKDRLFGRPLETCAAAWGLPDGALWPAGAPHTLWNAKLYPVCDGEQAAVSAALSLYALAHGTGDGRAIFARERLSLADLAGAADLRATLAFTAQMAELVRVGRLAALLDAGVPARDARACLEGTALTPAQAAWLAKETDGRDKTDPAALLRAMRLCVYVSEALGDPRYRTDAFRLMRESMLAAGAGCVAYRPDARVAREDVTVRLPLRVNFGGGWSDTPPYCIENGGTVFNAAITLNGILPVEVRILRIPEKKIVFDSRDMDVHGEYTEMGDLQRPGGPEDPFALQKACLLACGILPPDGGDLPAILSRLGGGFEVHSEVTGVPKGSGLGTSSILAAATVTAVMTFIGAPPDDARVYETVLLTEQIMSTGGGWEDQVGGLVPGFKFITAAPGLRQAVNVTSVSLPDAALTELSARYAIVYTGQRRLARNLLRDVVCRYLSGEPDCVSALAAIRDVAAQMRDALTSGDVDGFARLLDRHWALSQRIDAESTNERIEAIFRTVADLVDARMVCGAGGGGFLQLILKKGVTKAALRARLRSAFPGTGVDVYESAFYFG